MDWNDPEEVEAERIRLLQDETPPESEDEEQSEERPCEHTSVSDQAGYPEHSGRCRVFAVCDDCGEALGQTGWDSVL